MGGTCSALLAGKVSFRDTAPQLSLRAHAFTMHKPGRSLVLKIRMSRDLDVAGGLKNTGTGTFVISESPTQTVTALGLENIDAVVMNPELIFAYVLLWANDCTDRSKPLQKHDSERT